MTHPHLVRRPPSEGNRSVFTWAGWVKRGEVSAWQRIFTVQGSNGDNLSCNVSVQLAGDSYTNTFRFFDTMNHSDSHNTSNLDKYTEHRVKDCGGWYHFAAAIDTTAVDGAQRLKLYINGHTVKDIRHTDDNGAQGQKTGMGASDCLHIIGGRIPSGNFSEGLNAEMFDNYFIDGQALDASYFGYYRDGRGYTSQGAPRSDSGNYSQNNGAWHPLPPSSVKKRIESKGGFGTNGYYLPMNSVNHPGADFHIEPDTILKLKTDEQQPKAEAKGALVFRDDPYKSNLVLAISGYHSVPDGTSPIVDQSHLIKGSGNATTVTFVGSPRIRPMYNYYGSGIYFDGASNNQIVFEGAVPNPGTGDFTYEWWMNTYTFSSSYIGLLRLTASTGAKRFEIAIHSNNLQFYTDTGNWRDTGFSFQYRTEQWYHITFERHNGVLSVYVNGDIVYTVANTRDYDETFTSQSFGHHVSTYDGKLYDLRCYNGIAKYRGPFDCVKPYSEQYFERLLYENSFKNNINGWSGDSGASLSHDTSSEEMLVTNGGGDNTFAAALLSSLEANKKYRIVGRIKPSVSGSYTFRVRAGGSSTQYSVTSGLTNGQYYNFDTGWIQSDGTSLELGSASGGITQFYLNYVRIWSADTGYSSNSNVGDHQRTWRVTPSNFTNNFARMNIHDRSTPGIRHNGLAMTDDGNDGWSTVRATMGFQSGKWYWEIHHRVINSVTLTSIIGNSGSDNYNGARHSFLPGQTDDAGVTYYQNGKVYNATNQSAGGGAVYDSYNAGQDILAVALDMDNGAVWFSKNGIWQGNGNPSSLSNPARSDIKDYAREYFPLFGSYYKDNICTVNFGDNPTFCGSISDEGTYSDDNGIGKFKYEPPDGFLALCTKNLPEPIKSEEYFRAIRYRGFGRRTSYNTGIDADLAVIKKTSGTSDWCLVDTVRGSSRRIEWNTTAAEAHDTGNNSVDVGNKRLNLGTIGDANSSGEEYVAYLWRAGGNKGKYNYEGKGYTTAQAMLADTGVDVTSGVITPTGCSISRKAGFGIYTYTADGSIRTIANGLDIGAFHPTEGGKGVCIMTKRRDSSRGWHIAFGDIPGSGGGTAGSSNNLSYAAINQYTGSFDSGNNGRANITPDGKFFHVDGSNGNTFVAYIWKEVEGFSRIGVYRGNDSTSNSFVYCGFRPAFVMWRKVASGENWRIIDSARSPANHKTYQLFPGHTYAQSSEGGMEFFFNGFALRSNDGNTNDDADYVFMAFAESPMKYATAGH